MVKTKRVDCCPICNSKDFIIQDMIFICCDCDYHGDLEFDIEINRL